MNNQKKFILPISILIASFILGGFYYVSQLIKYHSIEQQQQLIIERDRKEYVAKRKMDCYEIYKAERANWNNVESNNYNEDKDVCEITYKNKNFDFEICEEKLKKYPKENYYKWREVLIECQEELINSF